MKAIEQLAVAAAVLAGSAALALPFALLWPGAQGWLAPAAAGVGGGLAGGALGFYWARRREVRRLEAFARRLAARAARCGHHFFAPADPAGKLAALAFHFEQLLAQVAQLSAELAERERLFTSILDSQRELVLVLDADGTVVYHNRAFARLFGAPSLDFDREGPRHSRDLAALLGALTSGGDAAQIHFRFEVDGQVRHIVWNRSPASGGEVPHTLFVGRDETEALELQSRAQRLERIATVGRAASTLFHELNQPLSALQLAAFMIREAIAEAAGRLPEELAEALARQAEVVESQVAKACAVVDGLRRFRRRRVARDPLPVTELFREAVAAVGAEFGNRGIRLAVRGALDELAVCGDRLLLGQVLVNLLKNAAEALAAAPPAGAPPEVVLSARAEGREVVLAVADNGPGMAPADLARATEPFFTTKIGGSGLGLAFCLDVVEALGGSLRLANRRSRGLRVEVRLPAPPGRTAGGGTM
ncbi:MAG: hypothetical protein KatS3mg124_1684 [Porticoccaceae bacterium]|nr:MAG: hypothetical protein KatS3mg124_1684 [Porticoccaceae bacterium]